jgi:hypothetical protein
MSIDVKALQKQKFDKRTKVIPVPRLKDWTKNGGDPTWTIQSLGTKEIWKAEVAASEESRNAVAQLSEALAGSDINEAAEQIKSLVGVSADIPQELAKRIFLLTFASIDPVCDLTTAGIIHEHFPTDFLNITQEILNISGLGSKKKESKSSGVTKK